MLDLAGATVPNDQCLDAESFAPVLLGQRDDSCPVRRAMLIDSSPGRDVNQDGGFTDASVVLTREGTVAATLKQAPAAKPRPRGKAKAPGKVRPEEAAARTVRKPM